MPAIRGSRTRRSSASKPNTYEEGVHAMLKRRENLLRHLHRLGLLEPFGGNTHAALDGFLADLATRTSLAGEACIRVRKGQQHVRSTSDGSRSLMAALFWAVRHGARGVVPHSATGLAEMRKILDRPLCRHGSCMSTGVLLTPDEVCVNPHHYAWADGGREQAVRVWADAALALTVRGSPVLTGQPRSRVQQALESGTCDLDFADFTLDRLVDPLPTVVIFFRNRKRSSPDNSQHCPARRPRRSAELASDDSEYEIATSCPSSPASDCLTETRVPKVHAYDAAATLGGGGLVPDSFRGDSPMPSFPASPQQAVPLTVTLPVAPLHPAQPMQSLVVPSHGPRPVSPALPLDDFLDAGLSRELESVCEGIDLPAALAGFWSADQAWSFAAWS
eukprot:m.55706 g.55706  ORF g.55706 m.55706 type:complete len:390 (-) comp6708_c0_seq2:210-1379(-)